MVRWLVLCMQILSAEYLRTINIRRHASVIQLYAVNTREGTLEHGGQHTPSGFYSLASFNSKWICGCPQSVFVHWQQMSVY